MTQEQVVNLSTVPVAAYLSELENGKVSVARSSHFASLVTVLRLSEAEVKAINPAAIVKITTTANEAPAHQPTHQPTPELERMFRRYADIDEELNDPVWRWFLANLSISEVATARDWYDVFSSLKRAGLNPRRGIGLNPERVA